MALLITWDDVTSSHGCSEGMIQCPDTALGTRGYLLVLPGLWAPSGGRSAEAKAEDCAVWAACAIQDSL